MGAIGDRGSSSSKLVEYSRKLNSQQEQRETPVSISQVNGQPMYLPNSMYQDGSKMLENGGMVVKNNNLHHSFSTQNNYHPNLKKTTIQKPIDNHQNHKDIPRSVRNDDGPEDDSDEMDNRILPQSIRQFGTTKQEDDPLILGASEDDDDLGAMDQSSSSGNGQWETVLDPHLYLLTELGNPYTNGKYKPGDELQLGRHILQNKGQFSMFRQQRKRRNSGSGPSLSIVNPLDVLRQRLLLEIARRRMRQSHNQIIANEEILRKIGRR